MRGQMARKIRGSASQAHQKHVNHEVLGQKCFKTQVKMLRTQLDGRSGRTNMRGQMARKRRGFASQAHQKHVNHEALEQKCFKTQVKMFGRNSTADLGGQI